jgi:hypothetical protein
MVEGVKETTSQSQQKTWKGTSRVAAEWAREARAVVQQVGEKCIRRRPAGRESSMNARKRSPSRRHDQPDRYPLPLSINSVHPLPLPEPVYVSQCELTEFQAEAESHSAVADYSGTSWSGTTQTMRVQKHESMPYSLVAVYL